MSAGGCWSLCVSPSRNWQLVMATRVNSAFAPGLLGFLSAHLCVAVHTLYRSRSSLRYVDYWLHPPLSLNTYSHNAYTNTPARMAHLTPEISEPWEVPDGGCRLGACSLTGLVLLDLRVCRSIPGDGRRGRKEWRTGYWLGHCRSTPLWIAAS